LELFAHLVGRIHHVGETEKFLFDVEIEQRFDFWVIDAEDLTFVGLGSVEQDFGCPFVGIEFGAVFLGELLLAGNGDKAGACESREWF